MDFNSGHVGLLMMFVLVVAVVIQSYFDEANNPNCNSCGKPKEEKE